MTWLGGLLGLLPLKRALVVRWFCGAEEDRRWKSAPIPQWRKARKSYAGLEEALVQ